MSLFNLSGIVSMFGTATVTVQRPAATVYVNGIAQPQTFATFTVAGCSVQPVRGADLERMPEGSTHKETATIFSPVFEFELRDRVTVPGRGDFEVEYRAPWAESGNYCKALCRALNEQEPRA